MLQKRPKNEQIDILPLSRLYVCKGNKNNSIKSQFGDFILAKKWRQSKKFIESVFKAKVESTYSSKCALKGRAFFHFRKLNLLTIVELTLTLMTNTPLLCLAVVERGVCKIS